MVFFYECYFFASGEPSHWNFETTFETNFLRFFPLNDSKRVRLELECASRQSVGSINLLIYHVCGDRLGNRIWSQDSLCVKEKYLMRRKYFSDKPNRFWAFEYSANCVLTQEALLQKLIKYRTNPCIINNVNVEKFFPLNGEVQGRYAWIFHNRFDKLNKWAHKHFSKEERLLFPSKSTQSINSWEFHDKKYAIVDTRLYQNAWKTIDYLKLIGIKALRIHPLTLKQYTKRLSIALLREVSIQFDDYAKNLLEGTEDVHSNFLKIFTSEINIDEAITAAARARIVNKIIKKGDLKMYFDV